MKIKCVKYKINLKNSNCDEYYILTSLGQCEYDINKIKGLYKKIWEVETDFGYSKKYLQLGNLKNIKTNILKQNIACLNFFSLISGFIESKINVTKKMQKLINILLMTF